MSLSNLLNIARNALIAHQTTVDITGHNIANASTEGYTRQRPVLKAETPLRTPWGQVGRGVELVTIDRPRNEFLDSAFRQENSSLGQFSTLRDTLGEIEVVFGEPSDVGLSASLEAFWNAWGDLANSPLSAPARAAVRSQGQLLANQFNSLADRVSDVRRRVREQLASDVDGVNSLTTQIADLNRQISSSPRGAADLEDARDSLLDELSAIAHVRVVNDADGSIRVFAGDAMLVDNAYSYELEVTFTNSGGATLQLDGQQGNVVVGDGSIAAHIETLESKLPTVEDQLDDVAAAVVTEVNALHRSGATLGGNPAGDFFDPIHARAATMALGYEIEVSADAIAAGTGGGPGDGSVALNIAALRDATVQSLGGVTVAEYYLSTVAALGQEVLEAEVFTTAQETLAQNFDHRRQSESGVSLDEEMVNLINHQQAYAAATRLVSAADEMIREVLRIV